MSVMLRRYRARHLKPRPIKRGPAVVTTAAAFWAAGSHAHAGTYVVRGRDTLSGIAARFGTTSARLAARNDISDPNFILVGRSLKVPGSSTSTGRHTVAAGETLSSIASQFGVSVQGLARANHLADPNFIVAGQSLTVPGARMASSLGAAPDLPAAAPPDYVHAVLERHSRAVGVEPALVKAVAWQESGWQQDVVSSAGAIGVMQVMPDTADFVNEVLGDGSRNVRSADDNVYLGVRYLKHMLDSMPTESKAIAAYLAGPGNVGRRLTKQQRRYVNAVLVHRERFR